MFMFFFISIPLAIFDIGFYKKIICFLIHTFDVFLVVQSVLWRTENTTFLFSVTSQMIFFNCRTKIKFYKLYRDKKIYLILKRSWERLILISLYLLVTTCTIADYSEGEAGSSSFLQNNSFISLFREWFYWLGFPKWRNVPNDRWQ